jgi:hypothetical protein
MRSTLTLLALTALLLSAPLGSRALACDECCHPCCDSAPAASAELSEELILRVLAEHGIVLSDDAIMIGAPVAAEGVALASSEPVALATPTTGESPDLLPVVFHVPVNFNDGKPVPAELQQKLEHFVCEQAGGFTVSAVEGAWEYEGKIYREPMQRFMVGLEPGKVAAFADAIEAMLKGDYQQIAVWFEIDGQPEIR